MASSEPRETDRAPCRATNWPAELETHRRWLRTVVLARLGHAGHSDHAADEVLQEVALAALSGRSPLHDPVHAGAWLYQVAVRQARLWLRREARENRRVNGYADRLRNEAPNAPSYDPLSWLLAHERAHLVRKGLMALSPPDRELLLLKYTEQWSYREMARHLGVEPGVIESRLHRARERLRRELARLELIEVKKHD